MEDEVLLSSTMALLGSWKRSVWKWVSKTLSSSYEGHRVLSLNGGTTPDGITKCKEDPKIAIFASRWAKPKKRKKPSCLCTIASRTFTHVVVNCATIKEKGA